jgi:multidrug efflux pump subunit AcrA (membrane-fusion protein)
LLRDFRSAWDEATVTVRFELDRQAVSRAPGATTPGWVILSPRNREALLIPYAAVLRSPEGPFVLVASGQSFRIFSKRPVQLGRVLSGFVAVLGGIDESDRVVIGNAFFLDAERRRGLPSQPSSKAMP